MSRKAEMREKMFFNGLHLTTQALGPLFFCGPTASLSTRFSHSSSSMYICISIIPHLYQLRSSPNSANSKKLLIKLLFFFFFVGDGWQGSSRVHKSY